MNPTYNAFTGKFMILNGRLTACNTFNFDIVFAAPSVYEVLRVMQGDPLFLEDHLARLENSMKYLCKEFSISRREVAWQIQQLSEANQIRTGNVKMIVSCPEASENQADHQLLICFIPHHYPSAVEYERGITMQTLELERPNPNAKFVNIGVTEMVNALKQKTGVDEVLLVNHEGVITEGSKANIFLVYENCIFTPARELVLPGITREKVAEICKSRGITLAENRPGREELKKISGAFITGTSPKVMPVRQIDDFHYSTGLPLISLIRSEYDEMIRNYLENFDPEKLPA